MISRALLRRTLSLLAGGALALPLWPSAAHADPSKYPQFAQHKLPENIKPEFIGIEELVRQLKAGAKPVIVDVRTAEEFREAHILSAVSAPLAEFKDYLKSMPRDRLLVLY
ncbi:MAG: rhodanese-like domain-containing protein [Candidatus Binatia bacterium]